MGGGAVAGAAFPTRAVNIAAALVFIVVGFATLRAGDPDAGAPKQSGTGRTAVGVAGSVALAIVLAALGAQTLRATLSLAASGESVARWIGATAGITSAGLLGVVFGGAIARRMPLQVVRLGAAALFLSIGFLVLTLELR